MKPEKDKHIDIRIDKELHFKLHYISKFEGRSANGQIIYLIQKCRRELEKSNGEIELPNDN